MPLLRKALALLILALAFQASGSAQSGTVMPVPRAAYYDANGDPCAGCKLYAFETGTNTDLAVYQEVTLTTAHAQPVVLDAAGRATIFLQNRTYRFRLDSSADVTIWTVDGVAAVPTASGNIDVSAVAGEAISVGEVIYLSDGSGSLTDGRWYRADADNAYSSSTAPIVGIATSAITTGATGTARIAGRVTGLSGLSAGDLYYVSATTGSLTSTEPTNSRFLGAADSTTTLVLQAEGQVGPPSLLDSNGSHAVVLRTTSDLTADRYLTFVPGDAARTVTLTGNTTLNQAVDTTATPSFSYSGIAEGRLTLTTATPVTTADVTAATTVYYTPYTGNRIALYTGTIWTTSTFTERSLSLSGYAADTNFDIFLYDNSGTLTLESTAWTNGTTRATAITMQDGVWVKSGTTTRRYLGTIRTTGTIGQTEDSYAKRFVWNVVNRVARPVRVLEATNTWAYTTATWRQANGATGNQIAVIAGIAEDALSLTVGAEATQTNGSVIRVAIGEDSTSTPSSASVGRAFGTGASAQYGPTASGVWIPALGYHFYAWLEWSTAAGTTTWFGDNGGTDSQSGVVGLWRS